MCIAIERAAKEFGYFDEKSTIKGTDIIPEMLKYKPNGVLVDGSWFTINDEGMTKRLEILDKLIEEFKNC